MLLTGCRWCLMLWWLKARRAHTLLPASYGVFVALVLLLQGVVADLPSFLAGGDNPVVATLMAPVPLYAALLVSLESRLHAAEDTGTRLVRGMDVGLVVAVVAAAALAGFIIGSLLESAGALAVGRNTAFLVGLMLSTRPLIGARAVMIPVVWLLAVMLFGFDHGHPYFWSVLPRANSDPIALAAAAVALAAGLTCQLTLRPRADS